MDKYGREYERQADLMGAQIMARVTATTLWSRKPRCCEGSGNTGQFQSIKSRLAGMSPAYTAEQIAKGQAKTGGGTVGTSGRRVVNVEPPSNSYRTHQPSDFLRVSACRPTGRQWTRATAA